METITITVPHQKIEYPESDGKPMAETDIHINALIYLREALKDYFRDEPQVYVAGNMLLYYEEGDPLALVAPDVFVVKGISKKERRIYKLWEEGRAPNVVIEISSRLTRLEDLGNKRVLYAMLGVQEYFLFDPLVEYLEPPLQGFRLIAGDYERLEPAQDGSLFSQVLGLTLRREDELLRLINPSTHQSLLTPAEAHQQARAEAEARHAAEQQVLTEAKARYAAEQRIQAETEARHAAEQRAVEAEAELAKLRAELAKLREENPPDNG
jgi:Uma2 family endonuclease